MEIMKNFGGDPEDQLLEAFRVIDSDNSGTISTDELKALLQKVCKDKVTDDTVQCIIREIDIDGDGQIDYEGERIDQTNVYHARLNT